MKKQTLILILFALLVVCSCKVLVKNKVQPQNELTKTEVYKFQNPCAELDSLIAKSWRLPDEIHAKFSLLYQKNDTLTDLIINPKYSKCLIGKHKQVILDKFGEATYNGNGLIYYKFLLQNKGEQSKCLKFWILSDTVSSIQYQQCYEGRCGN